MESKTEDCIYAVSMYLGGYDDSRTKTKEGRVSLSFLSQKLRGILRLFVRDSLESPTISKKRA